MSIDFHIHTTHSDGSFTPTEIISMAKEAGLTAIALTDHNTVSGVPAFMAEAARQGVTAVAGTELSTLYRGEEIHLLGLFIPEAQYTTVNALTAEYDTYKDESSRAMAEALTKDGYLLDFDEICRRLAVSLEVCGECAQHGDYGGDKFGCHRYVVLFAQALTSRTIVGPHRTLLRGGSRFNPLPIL